MKGIVWFFSLWLLILTGLPCPDAECHAQTSQTTPSSAPHSDDHKAPCSPFCHCTTCLGFAVPHLFSYGLPSQPSVGITALQVFGYQSPAYSTISFTIWQPPKY